MTTDSPIPDRLALDFYYLDESGHHTKAPANTKYFLWLEYGYPLKTGMIFSRDKKLQIRFKNYVWNTYLQRNTRS